MDKFAKKRTSLIFIVFCGCFLIIWIKAFKVQIWDRERLMARARSQALREATVYPKRGVIYDRNGNPLALNIQTYSIFTIPRNGKHELSYRKLAKIVKGITYRSIKKKIRNRSRYTWLARKVSLTEEQVKDIRKLKGIYIDAVPKRFYPNNELASQILGFVGIDNVGLSGIEYRFDEQLKGKPQRIKYIKDAKGRAVKFESNGISKKAKEIYLSIDKDLQAFAERALKDAVVQHKAIKGGVGVMDVESGEILAMANYPTFDPNKLKESRESDRKLSFVLEPFEPGSVLKILTVASSLEHKVASPDTNYYCNKGSITVDGYEINDSDEDKKHEWLSVKDIIKYSSNVGITEVAFALTYPKLKSTLDKFNIGRKMGIELPSESRGIFNDSDNVSALSLSNISFGQGVATTGIQILSSYAAIANGGYMVHPTILRRDKSKPWKKKRVLTRGISDSLSDMLVGAVEEGTGSNAKVKYFTIAGKTGTSQRPSPSGGYDGYISSFVGYPTNIRDRFVVYVYIDKPHKEYYGNAVAAPVFQKITQYILYKRKDFGSLAKGDSKIKTESISHISSAVSRYKNIGRGKIPDFIGLDKRSATLLADKIGVGIAHMGMGVVYKQMPQSGVSVKDEIQVVLHYRPPHYD